ncbi:hypothetical protein Tco_1143183 [Tanacetum coccineum]
MKFVTKLIVRTSLTLGFLSACLAFAVLNISKGHLRSLSISISYVGWQVNKKKLSERSARRISMYSNIKPENRLLDSEGKLKFSYLGLGALLQEGQKRVDLENGRVGRFRGLRNTLKKDLQSLFSSLGSRSLRGYMTRRRMKGQTQFG